MRGLFVIIAVFGAGLGAAGCTSGAPSTTTIPRQAVAEAASRDLVACMRANGVPDFPDLSIENGHLVEPQLTDAQASIAKQAAEGPCRAAKQSLDDALGGVGQPDEQQLSAAELDKVRQFAGCLRQHGLPQWPDPDATGTFHIAGSGLEPMFADKSKGMPPQVAEAVAACKAVDPAPVGWGIAN